tara:strand:- start:236 stop:541 length:306 start_codon:yes stop_codon:yes gene_type:complete
MKAALHVLPLQEQLLMLTAHWLLVQEQLALRVHKVNKGHKASKDQPEQLVLLVQQELRELPDHKVQQVQTELMEQMGPMVQLALKGHKVQLVHKGLKVTQV